MAYNFTDMTDVIINTHLYSIVVQGGELLLGLFPAIAQTRWTWIVDNWNSLFNRFLDSANGNQEDLLALDEFNKDVESYKAGNLINPLENNTKYKKFKIFLNQIPISEIEPSPQETSFVNETMLTVANFSESDFRNALSLLKTVIITTEQDIGLSDSTVLEIYGITPTVQKRSATIQDLEYMDDITDLAKIIKGFIFNLQTKQKRPPNLLKLANSNIADESKISIDDAFFTYSPIPFEISLEHMAKKFLGSSRYWYELVTVNNLQPPFIDEVGEKHSLLAPAAANNLIISDAPREYISPGSYISIGSHRKREESRIIERIIVNETNESLILFLSGAQDLSILKPSEGAFVRIFKPHTTRKGKFILIPSRVPAKGDSTAKPTPSKDYLARLEPHFINFGIDVARNETSGDWVINSTGNFQLAAGIKAIKQAVLNALKTELGELPFHPNYGVDHDLGKRFFGTAEDGVVQAEIIRQAILKDPRFEQALIHNLSVTEVSVFVQIAVRIAGLHDPIPLSFVS